MEDIKFIADASINVTDIWIEVSKRIANLSEVECDNQELVDDLLETQDLCLRRLAMLEMQQRKQRIESILDYPI